MLSDTEASCLAIALAVCLKKRIRRWMKEWLEKKKKYTNEKLLKDVRLSEPSDFQNFLRLDAKSSDERLKIITPQIKKKEYYHARCYSYKPASIIFCSWYAKI
jgi:hypothetical protein